MTSNIYLISVIVVITIVTVLTRALPFIAFGNRELPPVLNYFSVVLPPAIMITLVIYCIRNTNIMTAPHGLPEFVSLGVVALAQLIKKNMYVSIILGTVCYMVLV